jgi:hypothetical protein
VKGDGMSGACSTIGDLRNGYKILIENLKGRDIWDNVDVGGRMIILE